MNFFGLWEPGTFLLRGNCYINPARGWWKKQKSCDSVKAVSAKKQKEKNNTWTNKLNNHSEHKGHNICCKVWYKVRDIVFVEGVVKIRKLLQGLVFMTFFFTALFCLQLLSENMAKCSLYRYKSYHIIIVSRFLSLCLSVPNYGHVYVCKSVCAVCGCVNPLWNTTFLHRKAVVVAGAGGDSQEGLTVRPCKPQWMSPQFAGSPRGCTAD